VETQSSLENKRRRIRRILLADDNSVSRKVAAQMLTRLGYQVEAVSNGPDALRAAEREPYDLVVLDTHLPGMDGYAVTRQIRALPLEVARRVPVIALISGSTQRDRELREAAGIDDYISKPLRVRPLAAVLGRWDPTGGNASRVMSIDQDVLRSCLAVFGGQNPAALQELLDLFLGSVPPRLSDMREAIERGDAKAVRELAHGIRGSSGQVGAMSMSQTCASIEAVVATGSLRGVLELLDQLEGELERARQDLRTIAREGLNERRAESPSRGRTAMDLTALHLALSGKRVVAHTGREAGVKLDEAFAGTGCRVEHIQDAATAGNADLLFWEGNLDALGKLRDGGLRVPVIVLARKSELAQVERFPALNADFVGEPFHAEDLQLRACLRLTNSVESPRGNGTSADRVLVAEDDPLIARFLVSNLEGSGLQVLHVVDGDAALEALGKERFGLVVLDINMAKTDGYGVLSQLRLRPENRATPVLMLSSRIQEHDIVKAFDLGADDYVTKPFNPLELVFRIRRLMRRH
jgi:DNA-binding response OmpR family regulator/HPt (histidine-containing phosphotransfer) domain-containing protein